MLLQIEKMKYIKVYTKIGSPDIDFSIIHSVKHCRKKNMNDSHFFESR